MGSGCSRNASLPSEHLTENSATESLYPKAAPATTSSSPASSELSAIDLLSWIEKYDNLLVKVQLKTATVTWCNHAWKKMLGFSKSDIIGKPLFDIAAEDPKPELSNLLSAKENALTLLSTKGEKQSYNCQFELDNDVVCGCFSQGIRKVGSAVQEVDHFQLQENKLLAAADHIKEILQRYVQAETSPITSGSPTESANSQKPDGQPRKVALAQKSFASFKEFLPSKPVPLSNSGPLPAKKKFYTVEERRRLLLSNTSSADLLRKSNLGAMMKFQMDKSKKTSVAEKMAKIIVWTNVPSERGLLHSLLEAEGYEVVCAQSIDEVYHSLNVTTRAHNNVPLQFDILVLDVDRQPVPENSPPGYEPTDSGFALYDNIRLKYFPNELPVVFLSQYSSEQEERLLEGNEYLTRPVHKADFLSKVKNLVYIKKLNDVQTCFVPREFLDLLGCSTLTDIKLGKVVQRVMTVIFVDIRSFTTLSESMTPQENFQFINTYLSVIGPAIRQHRGFIDKFMGDGTLAIFPKSPSDAIFAALAIEKIAQDFDFNSRKIQIGVGVNTGPIMLGIIGEDCRMSCDVISSTVNMSSRLEELTKHYKCKVIASEHSFLPAKDVFGRELDHVRVVGIKEPIRIYEVWGADCDTTPELVSKKERYETGRKLFRERSFLDALEIFKELKQEHDVPSEIMYNRCLDLIQHPPPAEGWSYIFQFKHK